jgi:hypothetical protein
MAEDASRDPTTPTPVVSPPPPLDSARVATDLVFGVLAPLACLVFDPIVFRSGLGGPVVGNYAVVGYSAIALGLVALPVWLFRGRPAAFLAGLLAGGAVFALCLGLTLLPLSFLGLAMCIGVLGFTPFLTAWVFARNSRDAFRTATTSASAPSVPALAFLGFVIACGGPWAAHWYVASEVSRAVERVASDDPAEGERGVGTLRLYGWLQSGRNYDSLVWVYHRETDERRKQALARAYQRLTGQDIENRLRILLD